MGGGQCLDPSQLAGGGGHFPPYLKSARISKMSFRVEFSVFVQHHPVRYSNFKKSSHLIYWCRHNLRYEKNKMLLQPQCTLFLIVCFKTWFRKGTNLIIPHRPTSPLLNLSALYFLPEIFFLCVGVFCFPKIIYAHKYKEKLPLRIHFFFLQTPLPIV